jgi:hypothetical protein
MMIFFERLCPKLGCVEIFIYFVPSSLMIFEGLWSKRGYVRFEVFTAVTMKNGVFWDVMPCGSCKNRRFGGT